MEVSFDVAGFLVADRASILASADAEVVGRRLPHYEAAGADEIRKRLAALFDVVVTVATENQLDPALAHADDIAAERQQTGHDLSELQRAINALDRSSPLIALARTPWQDREQGFCALELAVV